MIRVVHLFNVKRGVAEAPFVEWLDAKLDAAARRFGCVERRTWQLLDGFEGDYLAPRMVRGRPRYVNEAIWHDMGDLERFRDWLTGTPEGRELHDRWFSSIEDHTLLRYVEGWEPVPMEG